MKDASYKLARRVFAALNVTLLVVLVALAFRFTSSTGVTDASPPRPTPPLAQARVQSLQNATLVLALATDCPYCEQSLPFYRALLATRPFGTFHTTAAFAESVSVARQYLKERDLSVDDVRKVSFTDLHVAGTPTLLVLDDSGHVKQSWKGLLSAEQQREIVDMLGVHKPFLSAAVAEERSRRYDDAARAKLVSAGELAKLLGDGTEMVIVDTRERERFDRSHIEHAINIPFDELPTRVPIELPKDKQVFVFCQYEQACEERYRERRALTYCTLAASVFSRAGISDVNLLTADLDKLRAAHVPLVSSTRTHLKHAVLTSERQP